MAGDAVRFVLSRARALDLDPAASAHLFFGDETSIASAQGPARAATDARVSAWFEVASLEDRWPDGELAPGVAVRWVPRVGERGAELSARLAVEGSLVGEAGGSLVEAAAYVTGEVRLCGRLRGALLRYGLPPGRIRAFPYWRERPSA